MTETCLPEDLPKGRLYLYKLVNTVNDKLYIGVTRNPRKRFYEHISLNSNSALYISRATAKYGGDRFSMEIIALGEEQYILSMEVRFISELRTQPPHGYNISPGGSGNSGLKWSEDSINNISGINSAVSTLSAADLDFIIDETSLTTKEVSERLNVSYSIVSLVRRGKTYKNHRDVSMVDFSVAEARARGESRNGELSSNAVLSECDVTTIINDASLSNREAGALFGVSSSTIFGIRSGRKWRHMPRPDSISYSKEKQKISTQMAKEIVCSTDLTGAEIARHLGVSVMSVSEIRSGKTWKWLVRPEGLTYPNGRRKPQPEKGKINKHSNFKKEN